MPAGEVPPNDGPPAADTAPGNAQPPKRVVVSEDLPLTLFIAVLTTIVMSIVNAAPQLLWIGVVLVLCSLTSSNTGSAAGAGASGVCSGSPACWRPAEPWSGTCEAKLRRRRLPPRRWRQNPRRRRS